MNLQLAKLSLLIALGSFSQWSNAAAPDVSTKVVAHRGLLLVSPENTMANFRACLQLRVGFELDVRRSKDGHLVCVHDVTVDRTTNGSGKVNDLTLEQLKQLDAGSWFAEQFQGERIPTIDEVFALLAETKSSSDVVIAIDVKGEDAAIEADIVTFANRHQVLNRLLMIGRTISDESVRQRFQKADNDTQIACVANHAGEFERALADKFGNWVYVRYVPSRDEVRRVHEAGKRVFIAGKSVAGKEDSNWRRCAAHGIDAILTDYSTDLAQQLRADSQRVAEIARTLQSHYSPPKQFQGDLGDYPSPLKFGDDVVSNPSHWQSRRQAILKKWHERMGPWPELLAKPRIKYLSSTRRENFIQHQVHVEVYPDDGFTEGHLLVPIGRGPFPAALVTFYDSATSIGLKERGRGTHDYGLQLVRRGFVTLSIGTPGSIEKPGGSTRSLLTEAGEAQNRQPLSYLAYVAANCHTALAELPQVDADRIGVVGLSYGGKWSMFASCLYDKFACAVWSDPGIVFNEKNSNVNYWEPWYLGYEKGVRRPAGVPNAERPRTGLYKRLVEADIDLNELHALICPRPVLLAGGTEDPVENWRALNHLVEVNKVLGVKNRVAMTNRKTHVPTAEALEKTLMFLEYHLKYR